MVIGMRWRFMVDLTFYPWDGKGHCKQAYLLEKDENFYHAKNNVLLVILSLITFAACAVMIIPFWAIFGVKTLIKYIVKKKRLN